MIVEDIDNDPFAMAEFRLEPLPALSGMNAGLCKGVDATVQVQTEGQTIWKPGRYGAFNEVAHQSAKLQVGVCSGQVEVNEVIQTLRILLCKIRISKAISALLAKC